MRRSVVKKEFAAVVFDMDGLMFNTEDLYDEITREVLELRGFEFTRELKVQIMGRPGHEALQMIIDTHGLTDTIDQLAVEIGDGFSRLLKPKLRLLAGLESLLHRVEQLRIPKAVATGSSRPFAETALRHFDLVERFKSILTSDDVTRGKPHPEIYLKTAEALEVEPTSMLVFEDSFLGSQAAAASGAFTVAVPGSHSIGCDFGHVDMVATSLADDSIQAMLASR